MWLPSGTMARNRSLRRFSTRPGDEVVAGRECRALPGTRRAARRQFRRCRSSRWARAASSRASTSGHLIKPARAAGFAPSDAGRDREHAQPRRRPRVPQRDVRGDLRRGKASAASPTPRWRAAVERVAVASQPVDELAARRSTLVTVAFSERAWARRAAHAGRTPQDLIAASRAATSHAGRRDASERHLRRGAHARHRAPPRAGARTTPRAAGLGAIAGAPRCNSTCPRCRPTSSSGDSRPVPLDAAALASRARKAVLVSAPSPRAPCAAVTHLDVGAAQIARRGYQCCAHACVARCAGGRRGFYLVLHAGEAAPYIALTSSPFQETA